MCVADYYSRPLCVIVKHSAGKVPEMSHTILYALIPLLKSFPFFNPVICPVTKLPNVLKRGTSFTLEHIGVVVPNPALKYQPEGKDQLLINFAPY